MAQTVCVIVSASDRQRLEADRGGSQPAWQAGGAGAGRARVHPRRAGATGRGTGRHQPADGVALGTGRRLSCRQRDG